MFWKKKKRFPVPIENVDDLIRLMEEGIIENNELRALLDLPEFEFVKDEDKGKKYENPNFK